jgi:uncharacterized repeat protein (TIGR01451 family)
MMQFHHTISWQCRILPTTLVLLLLLLLQSPLRAFPAGQQTYHILGHEQLILNILKTIDVGEFGGNFLPAPPQIASSVVSLTVPATGQRIIYDHGEDGYEADLLNPTQASTEIWGDGNPGNGIPPGDPGGDDILVPGQVISLESTLTGTCGATCTPVPINPRGTNLRWDGLDIAFTVGQPMTAVHTIFPADGNTGSGSQTVIGGTWELFPRETYQESLIYTIPVGVDTYTTNGGDGGFFENFKYCEIVVQATEDATAVIVDNQAGPPLSFVLNKGESWSSLGEFSSGAPTTGAYVINQNTTVMGGKPLQVGLVTANAGAFGTRFYNIIPTGIYASEYMSPVYSSGPRPPAAAHEADIFINNPNLFSIQVTAEDTLGQTILNIPSNSAVSLAQAAGHYVPTGSAVRLSSANLFWGIGAYDTGGLVGNGTGADWGWVLQANGFLENAVTCPHGPGNSGVVDPSQANAGNGSPIWIGVLDDNTTVNVDWTGDGVPDPADINNDGVPDGTNFTLNALQSLVLYDPSGDNNQAPARVEADGNFSAAWGYNGTGGALDTGVFTNIDWGYSINPFDFRFMEPVLDIEKTAFPKSVTPSATVTFTLVASSGSLVPVTDVDLVDTLPDSSWSYVPGSAQITYPDLSIVQLDPTISGQTLTWDISQTLQTQEDLTLTFQATVGAGCATSGTTITENWNTPATPANPASYQNGSGWTGNWSETGETTNPVGNDIQVRNAPDCFDNHLAIWDGGSSSTVRSITRQVDTSGFCSPQISFLYEVEGIASSNEYMTVEASVDGTTYTPIRIYGDDSGTCHTQVLDLTNFKSATTYIRFLGDVDNENSDRLLVDDIVVSDAGTSPANITENFDTPTAVTDPASYTQGSGWSGDWLEAGETTDVNSGEIQVRASGSSGGPTCVGMQANNVLRFDRGRSRSIRRRLNLAGFTSPQISFNSETRINSSNEHYYFEASSDGSTWTILHTWSSGDTGNCDSLTFSLSSYTSTAAHVRFRGNGNLDGGSSADRLWIDNIVISETSPQVCTPSGSTATEDWETPTTPTDPGSYQNGSGWTGNWFENGETTNATANDIRVRGDPTCFVNYLGIHDGGSGGTVRYVVRQVDTSSFCAPELNFDYQIQSLASSNENMLVEASTDGVSYTPIRIFGDDSGGCRSQVLDLTGFQSSTTYIRFGGDIDNESTDRLLIDDIVIKDAGSVPADITENFDSTPTPRDPESYTLGVGWSGDWTENGETTDVDSGEIRIRAASTNPTCANLQVDNILRLQDARSRSVQRRINLSGFVSPQISFDSETRLNASNEHYFFDVSTNGSSWTTVHTWSQADTGNCDSLSFDLTPYIAAGSYIRFRGNNQVDGGGSADRLFIDNIVITETAGTSSAPFWDNQAQGTGFYKGFPVASKDEERVYNSALVFTKSVSQSEAVFGDILTYTLTLQNVSAVAIPNVAVRDPVPAFSTLVGGSIAPGSGTYLTGSKTIVWNVGTINAGQTLSFSFKVTVGQVPFDLTPMTNKGTVTLGGIRALESNVTDTLVRTPIFQLLKKAPGAVSTGGFLRYDFDLYNNGVASASGVVVTDRIPAGTAFFNDGTASPNASYSSDNGSTFTTSTPPGINPAVTHVQFGVGSMAVASLTTATFTVQVLGATPVNTVIRNFATLVNNETSIRTTNITETVVTDLQMTLASQETAACPRRRLRFSQTVTNNGPTPFTNIVVVQPIPIHSEYEYNTATAPTGWTLEYSTDSAASFSVTTPPVGANVTHLRYSLASLAAGVTNILRFDSRVSQFVPASVNVTGQGTIDSNETPLFSSNQLVLPTVNIRVVKSVDRLTATPGDTIHYTLTVQNIGAKAVTGAKLRDPIPGYNTFSLSTLVPGSPSPAATFSGGLLEWNLPTLIPLAPPLTYSFETTVNAGVTSGTTILNVGNAIVPGICEMPSNVSQVLIAGTGVSAGPNADGYGDQGDTVYFSARATNESTTVSDTLDLTAVSSDNTNWPTGSTFQIFIDLDGDGLYDPSLDVLATDTDFDSTIDTGLLAPGQTAHILVAITIPGGVPDLDTNLFTVTATSSNVPGNTSSFTDTIHVIGSTLIFLKDFKATDTPSGVEVTWRTLSEFQNQGFDLYRGPSPVGPWEQVGCCMIPGMGTFPAERHYRKEDPDAPRQGPLYYRLVDVDFLGRRRSHPPVGVDRDGDGIPFDVEARLGLSDQDASDAASDPDGDGLSIAEELTQGSDPFSVNLTQLSPTSTVATQTPPPDGIRVLEESPDAQILEIYLSGYDLLRRTINGTEYHYPELSSLLSGHSGEAGLPQLPLVGLRLPGEFDQVHILEVQEEVEDGVLVGPAPDSREGPSNLLPLYATNSEFYQGSGSTSEEAATLRPSIGPGGKSTLVFHPFVYDHGTHRLRFRKRTRVRVSRSGRGRLASALGTPPALGLTDLPPGPVFRLRTQAAGVYRVTGAELRAAGVPLTGFDPTHLAIFHKGQEIPIRVVDQHDGVFDDGDFLEFYAWHEGDRYAEGDGFHLLLGATPGRRWLTQAGESPTGPFLTSYRHKEVLHYRQYYSTPIPGAPEEDRFVAHSGLWVNNTTPKALPISVTAPAPLGASGVARLTYGSSLDFEGTPDHHHILSFDGVQIGEQTWSGSGFHVAAAAVPPEKLTSGSHQVQLALSLKGLPTGVHFDFVAPRDLELEYSRLPVAIQDQLTLTAPSNGDLDLEVRGFHGPDPLILDISSPQAPILRTQTEISGTGPFQVRLGRAPSTGPENFHIFTSTGTHPVTQIRAVHRAGLRTASRRAGWIAIIPDESFRSALAPLVSLRQTQGLEPLVVSLEDLADEFTGGVVHPDAIREFLRLTHRAWNRSPRYVLLIGEGNANPRGYPGLFFPGFPFTSDPVLMPTPLSMSGPGFLRRETANDMWYGRLVGGDDDPEMAVGRWNVRSPAELTGVVAKAVAYANSQGNWRRTVLSVADDGEPIFPQYSDAALAPLLPGLQVDRYYQSDPGFGGAAGFISQLHGALNTGGLLVQFVGHGGFSVWTDDAVMDDRFAASMRNAGKLPLVVSMTCEDGYFANVAGSQPSLAEAMALNPGGGAIAYLASGIQTTAVAKDLFHRSFMEALFQHEQRRIGDALLKASELFLANSQDPENLLRAFNLIGDPATALRIRNPLRPVQLTAIFQADGSIRLNWGGSSDPDVTRYEIYRRVGNGPMTQIGQTIQTSFLVAGNNRAATPANQYFTVRAVTSDGLGSSLPPEVLATQQAATAAPTPAAAPAGASGGTTGGCQATTRSQGCPFTFWLALLSFLGLASQRRWFVRGLAVE